MTRGTVHVRRPFYLSLLFSGSPHPAGCIFPFLPCPSLLFSAIRKGSSGNLFAFLHFCFFGVVLVTTVACGICLDQGPKPCPLHWPADSQSLNHEGSAPCLPSKSLQSCPTLCDPMDCGPPGSVHGILQARILEWVVILSSRGSSRPRN